ncbi:acyltransferase [Methylotenera sp.]|uniref:acyltransferase family protein n=1 Tax=Methylotenera sp. TaxID=2051956 RepID=UPI0024881CF3|nr:acyltransferase [Methylotenera sp.]MDI1361131.1 acyltransferase [Methylotenera sp.]
MTKQHVRINEVDGIRGWAAFLVLLFHAFGEMLKFAVPAVHFAWFAPFLAGDIAVAIFFILSGDALSSGFFAGGGERAIDRLLVRRYLRLTIPIFMSCLLTYLIMATGLDFHMKAAEILQRQDWLGQFLQFNQSLLGFLRYSIIGVYISHTRELSYNPFLWTMSVEMIGSMLVFLLCYLWHRLKKPHLLCFLLLVWLAAIGSFFSLFFAGMLMGHYRQQGLFEKLLKQRNYQLLAFAIVVIIIGTSIATAGIHRPAALLPLMLCVAMVLVFCFYTQRHLKAFFSNKFSLFLGEISFPLYLVHFQVLISLMSWLVIQDYTAKGSIDQMAFLGFACLTVVVSMLVAWCFRLIEQQILKRADALVLPILI